MGLKRFPQYLVVGFALLPVFLVFQNCSSYNDPSPFEYSSTDPGKLISGPGDLLLGYPKNSLNVDINNSAIRASGDCNVGGSTSHRIEVTMTNQLGNPIPVREDAGCPQSGAAICNTASQFQCEHGRYNILLPVNCSAYPLAVANPNAFNSNQTLRAQLVSIDSKGVETREAKASFSIAFAISWAPNICP